HHQTTASTNKDMLASVNHGSPTVAATSKAGTFSGQGVVGAKAVTGIHPTGNNAGTGVAKGATGTFNALSKRGTVTPTTVTPTLGGAPKGATGNLNALPKQGTVKQGTVTSTQGGTAKGATFNALSKQGTGSPTPGGASSRLSNTGG